jgi:CRISPR-associated protein Cmr3
MKHIKLTPLDTLFFRDGSPFNAGETGQMEVASVFPPNASTVVGCLRAAFARALGWSGHGRWKKDITDKLGDGADLGSLEFTGPYLLKDQQCLFPAPTHLLMGKTTKQQKEITGEEKHTVMKHLTFLRPGDEAIACDLSSISNIHGAHLPETISLPVQYCGYDVNSFKPLGQAYLTRKGMQQVLAGQLPHIKHVIESEKLWRSETRIGIERNDESRTTEDSALYQVAYTRLAKNVSLGMGVLNYGGDVPKLATLGGESRMVCLEKREKEDSTRKFPTKPDLQATNNIVRYTVILVTPAKFTGWQKPKGTLPDLPGEIVSACVGKPVLVGGWFSGSKDDNDAKSKTYQRGSRPLEPYLPAGSVFFMAAPASEIDSITIKHNTKIGENTHWGYGQILIGAWT